jgi:hypothetical protein
MANIIYPAVVPAMREFWRSGLDGSSSLFNHGCDTNIEIGNDLCYHVCWHIPDFPSTLSALLEPDF